MQLFFVLAFFNLVFVSKTSANSMNTFVKLQNLNGPIPPYFDASDMLWANDK